MRQPAHFPEMLKEWAELYDGGDPTNPTSWMEYYICIGALDIWGRFFGRAATVDQAAFFHYTIVPAICQEKS